MFFIKRSRSDFKLLILTISALSLLFSGCFHNPADSEVIGDHYQLFAIVWEEYEANYPEFTLKGVNWKQLFYTYSPAAEEASSDEEVILNAIIPMLSQLEDLHAWVTTPDDSLIHTFAPQVFPNYDYTVLCTYLIPAGFTGYSGNVGYCDPQLLPYVSICSWAGIVETSRVRDFIERCEDLPAIIIDVRMNGGGWGAPASEIAGFFTDTPRLAYLACARYGPGYDDISRSSFYTVPDALTLYEGQVYLLVGEGSASACEMFILHMNCLDNITVLGDTTAGAGVMHLETELKRDWKIRIPQWSMHTPDMVPVEWFGIPPDIYVEATEEDFARGIDPVLEYAIELVNSQY